MDNRQSIFPAASIHSPKKTLQDALTQLIKTLETGKFFLPPPPSACIGPLGPLGCNTMNDPALDRQIQAITRPDKALWTYYILVAAVFPPAFPFLILPLYFRHHTMRYKFTDDGISMSWGILFRREIILNYARIQDIHLKSNVVERWLGLARILVQTASGSHSAEMTIEGIKEFEPLRDFLYNRMRGVKDGHAHPAAPASAFSAHAMATSDELTTALRDTAHELRALRETLEKRGRSQPEEPRHV
jgi:uncharacterized protein